MSGLLWGIWPSHLGSEQADEAQPRAKLACRTACRDRGQICGHFLCQQVRRRPQHLARQVVISCAGQQRSDEALLYFLCARA